MSCKYFIGCLHVDIALPLKHNSNMNALSAERRAQVIAALVEGTSMRSVSRITGVTRNTITSLLVAVGAACAEYQDKALRNLPCKRIQTDEIWAFCYGKDRNLPVDKAERFRLRQCLDMDSHRQRYETDLLMDGRQPGCESGAGVYEGSRFTATQSHPANN